MKKLKIILIIFTSLVIYTSCDKYVDIEPRGSAIAKSMSDVEALLNNGSVFTRTTSSIQNLLSDNVQLSEGDIADINNSTWTRHYAQIYEMKPVFFDASQTDYGWQYHYQRIAQSNYIMGVLETIEGEQTKKDAFIAEALVHRAYAYFELVNTYGHHYGHTKASEAGSGVPVLLKAADTEESLERKSTNEVYEMLVNDLTSAIAKLDAKVISMSRPHKASAQALLAKVYFHMGDYTNALSYANDALAFNSELVDYNTLNVGIPLSGNNNPEFYLIKEEYNTSIGQWPNYRGMYTLSDELVALFELEDNRLTSVFGFTPSGNYTYGYTNYSSYRFIMGPTVPEMMLIKAECLARSGSTTDAMDIVNDLRAKRYLTASVTAGDHILTAANQTDAIQKVIDERRREFHVWGRRFHDVKRLNALHDAGISLTRGSVTWAPNSINWAAPISQKVIDTGKGQIEQNTRE